MRIVIGVTGASGIILAYRLAHFLLENKIEIELVLSTSAQYTAALEMEKELATPKMWLKGTNGILHNNSDIGATICSGSYKTDGMVIIPCSMSTLAAISVGLSDNCIRRAADVTLKERRPLILVPRETPFSEIHLENLLRLSKRGAIILPPVPGWYTKPTTLEEMENFIVGKVLDALRIEHTLYKAWAKDCCSSRGN